MDITYSTLPITRGYVGYFEPRGTADWQCPDCGMWFDGSVPAHSVGVRGPYCPHCWDDAKESINPPMLKDGGAFR